MSDSICRVCSGPNHPERAELGIDWCMSCSLENPALSRPQFCVLGMHKSAPIVVAPDSLDWTRQQSYMRAK